MSVALDRRRFLGQVAAGVMAAGGSASVRAENKPAPHGLTHISGAPRERGRMYGQKFKESIHVFLDRELYKFFAGKPSTKEQMLRYAGECGKAVRGYSNELHDELEGVAEGAGIRLEEAVLITCHEELWHKGVLPQIEHCTAVAIGPPDTKDGRTYVGQTWDWMQSVFGMSSMLLWKRTEGPSLLAYAFPGLWCGAGLNSAGLALCWTSAFDKGKKIPGPRVGIPSYLLLTHLLYQETLKDVVAEAKRANHAGWFTFVMADAKGNLLNIEGSPKELAIEEHKGALARVLFGSKQMTSGDESFIYPRTRHMYKLLAENKGQLELTRLQNLFADPSCKICQGKSTIDMMVWDCSTRTAHVSRGSSWGTTWRSFTFDSKEG